MEEISYTDFLEMLIKKPIFFINSFEEAAIRTEIEANEIVYYVKFRGEKEFKALNNSSIVAGGIEEHILITQEEYENH